MSAKKRVRFAEAPDMVREFEVEHKKVKKELDPMEQLEGVFGVSNVRSRRERPDTATTPMTPFTVILTHLLLAHAGTGWHPR